MTRLRGASQIGLAILALLLLVSVAERQSRVDSYAGSNRIEWAGKARFTGGANLPWFSWGCDFGCGVDGGVSDPEVRSEVASRVRELRATGFDAVRWWMFEPSQPGEVWQIAPGAGGQLELNAAVYADIDAALQIAEREDVYFDFVLFSGVGPEQFPSRWLTNGAQRQQVANALAPLFARYAGHPRILAWELFNEPEWQVWKGETAEADAVALATVLATTIHSRTATPVTIGSAMIDGIPMWKDVALDFYSPHWYGTMAAGDWCALCRDYASIARQYGISKPIVIGEWDGAPGSNAAERWQHWLDAGYAGAWGWSLFPEHTFDHIAFDFPAARAFVAGNGASLGGSATPPPPPSAPSGLLTGTPPARGSFALLVVSRDTSAGELVASAGADCPAPALAVLQSGTWRVYVAGAPLAVNARFPTTLPAATPLMLRCGA